MTRTIHLSFDIDYLLTMPNSNLENKFRNTITKQYLTAAEVREHFNELKAEGYQYYPLAWCDNFNPQKGCMGHHTEKDA